MKLIVASLLVLIFKLINSTEINNDFFCPPEYKLIPGTKICILIMQKAMAYTNLCLATGSTSTFYYLELILERNVTPIIDLLYAHNVNKFWLPIAKDEQNFLVWKLPMPLWNRNIVEMNDVAAPKTYAAGKCAVYETYTENWFMDDCHNEYPHVCFYDTMEPIVVTHSGFCANNLMGRLPIYHGTCFEIEVINGNTTMNKETVLLNTNEKKFVVTEFIKQLGMTATKILVSAMNYTNVLAIQNGVVFQTNINDVHYRLVEDKITVLNKKPSIDISYQIDNDTVVIAIRNFEYLWNPHINDVPLTCHYDINMLNRTIPFIFNRINVSDTKQFYNLTLPHYQGVGNLWCEAQTLFTFETITSNRLMLNRNVKPSTKVMCVSIESDYCGTCSNIYIEFNRISEFTNRLNKEIQFFHGFDVYDVQLKKIIRVHANRTKYLYHIIMEATEKEYIASYFKNDLNSLELIDYEVTEVRLNDECSSSHSDYFSSVKLNEKSVIKKMCLLDSGLPPTQECVGNLIDGAKWRQVYDINELLKKKCNTHLENVHTKELFKLNEMLHDLGRNSTAGKNETRAIIEKTLSLVSKTVTMKHNQITDIRYATETLHNLLETVPADIFVEMPLDNVTQSSMLVKPICEIIDTILNQETNSLININSDKILETIELMAEKIADSNIFTLDDSTTNKTSIEDNNHNDVNNDEDDGVILLQQKNFIVMIVNPLIKNITGIALYKIDQDFDEKSFLDFNVRKLHSDDTWHTIYNETLEITAHIPTKSFNQIKVKHDGELVPPNCIIFKIYYKNSLFNENVMDFDEINNGTTETIESESKVIGITIPNYYEIELPSGIFTMFKTKQKLADNKLDGDQLGCSDNAKTAESQRQWNRNLWNYDSLSNSIVMCPVKRLANIGFVKLFGNKIVTDETSILLIRVLHYTTVVGCTLSLVGLIVIFVTAIIYDDWKSREATPLILNVGIATFLQLAIFVIAESGQFKQSMDCLIIGGILHYVTLAGCFISLFVTNCQYRRYIIVFGSAKTKYFKTKILIFGWIAPLLIVSGCLFWTPNSYIPSREHHELGGICYPTELILYLFVHGPIILIFCINVCIYIWIVLKMTHENPNLRKIPKKSKVVMQIRLFIFIFFMLSLTWAFGLLAHYLESLTFATLFNVMGPMQGFCLFIFSVVIDNKTRLFWMKFLFSTKK